MGPEMALGSSGSPNASCRVRCSLTATAPVGIELPFGGTKRSSVAMKPLEGITVVTLEGERPCAHRAKALGRAVAARSSSKKILRRTVKMGHEIKQSHGGARGKGWKIAIAFRERLFRAEAHQIA